VKRQVIIASSLLAVSFILGSCAPCSHGVQNEILSPSGKMVVTIYQTDCGATTDFATGLSVRRAGERFRPSENNLSEI
jgi:hypothetical protein